MVLPSAYPCAYGGPQRPSAAPWRPPSPPHRRSAALGSKNRDTYKYTYIISRLSFSLYIHIYMYIYIYMYICI